MGTELDPNENTSSPQPPEEPSMNGGDRGSVSAGLNPSDAPAGLNPSDAPFSDHDGGRAADQPSMLSTDIDAMVQGNGNVVEADISGTGDPLGDNELLGAVTFTSPDVASSVEHTLDHLTTSTDLFDVPVLDFDDSTPT